MESMSPIPPDPYAALGLTKDCKPTDIKVAYRKLALKWHPDKVAENQKDRAQEEFHKVQQAYEILSDEDKRQHYDASVRLAELRRINLEMRSANAGLRVDTRSTGGGYETRTAVPSSAVPPRGPVRSYTTDDRTRSSYYSDEDIPRPSARRADYSYVRRSPRERESDRDREKARQKERDYEDRERRDAQRRAADKARDTERGYDRSAKGDRLREDESASRDADGRRRERDTQESRRPSLYREEEQQLRAESYIASSRRPAPVPRAPSSRDYAYVRSRQPADSSDRRSPPRERERPSSSRRESEIVSDRGGRAPPPLRKTDSEPNPLQNMVNERPDTHRANTTQTDYDRRRRTSLDDEKSTPSLPRSTTMPVQSNGSAKVHAPSRLRESESYTSSSSRVKTYSIDETNGATLREPASSTKDSTYKTVFREPTSSRSAGSGSQKPSLSMDTKSGPRGVAHMMADLASPSARTPASASSSTYTPYQDRRPTYTTTDSSRSIRPSRSPDREPRRSRADDRPLYGEIGRGTSSGTTGYSRDPKSSSRGGYFDTGSSSSQSGGSGNYSRRFNDESVRYSEGRPRVSRENSYASEGGRPGLSRSSTAVY